MIYPKSNKSNSENQPPYTPREEKFSTCMSPISASFSRTIYKDSSTNSMEAYLKRNTKNNNIHINPTRKRNKVDNNPNKLKNLQTEQTESSSVNNKKIYISVYEYKDKPQNKKNNDIFLENFDQQIFHSRSPVNLPSNYTTNYKDLKKFLTNSKVKKENQKMNNTLIQSKTIINYGAPLKKKLEFPEGNPIPAKARRTLTPNKNIKTQGGNQEMKKNNFSSTIKKDKFLMSTLPRAKIDISGSDKATHWMNISYDHDEIVNFYLKLKNKAIKLSPEIINELKLLRNDITQIIKEYEKSDKK